MTVRVAVPLPPPFRRLAFMVTVPVLTPVARPFFFLGTLTTVAMDLLEEVQVRFTELVRSCVSPPS